jgi:acyl carrier protein
VPSARILEREIATLFAEKLHLEVPSVDTDLIETGLVDSLALVELMAQLEEGFGIQVSLEDIDVDRFRTISSIASLVAAKTARVALPK